MRLDNTVTLTQTTCYFVNWKMNNWLFGLQKIKLHKVVRKQIVAYIIILSVI